MHTSYFARLSKIEKPVSISRYAPQWYIGPEFKLLAPSPSLLRAYKMGSVDEDGYRQTYQVETLDELDAQEVYDQLVSLAGEDATLLCYEKPGDFCHRRLVAAWFKRRLGITVNELKWQ